MHGLVLGTIWLLQNETRGDEFALEVVSYIGCAISIISLLIAVVFYLAQG